MCSYHVVIRTLCSGITVYKVNNKISKFLKKRMYITEIQNYELYLRNFLSVYIEF